MSYTDRERQREYQRAPIAHGTTTGYRRGCRCRDCLKAVYSRMVWTRQVRGWYTHPKLGGVCREINGWWWYPLGSTDRHGAFATLAEAQAYAGRQS